jgi:hypothetical protein
MRLLIRQVRDAMPFDVPRARVCTGLCNGCSVKLLDYLDTQLSDWEARLAAGERPGLADLSRLGGTSRKAYRALAANGLVPMEPPTVAIRSNAAEPFLRHILTRRGGLS